MTASHVHSTTPIHMTRVCDKQSIHHHHDHL